MTFDDWQLAVSGLADACRSPDQPDPLASLVMDMFRLAYLCSLGKQYRDIGSLRDPALLSKLQPRPSECLRKAALFPNLAPSTSMSDLFFNNPDTSAIVVGDNTLVSAQDEVGRHALVSSSHNNILETSSSTILQRAAYEGGDGFMGEMDRAMARGASNGGVGGGAMGGIGGVVVNGGALGMTHGDAWTVYGVPLEELGRVSIGEWKQEESIGKGKYGEVYRATLNNIEVAAKKFKSSEVEPFLREVYFNARLRHPGIVAYRGYYQSSRSKWFFMELMKYSFFSEFIEKPGETPAPLNVRVRWALQVATTIRYMHDLNIIHRDINPKNVLISHNFTAKICDFTFSTAFETKSKKIHRQDGLVIPPIATRATYLYVGTPRYMAPEIEARDCSDYEASDVWSLSMTIFDILSNKRPFRSLGLAEDVRDHLIAQLNSWKQGHPGAGPFVKEARLNVQSIPGMPDVPESRTLIERLTSALSFDPQKRPPASKLSEDLFAYEKFLRSNPYKKARERDGLPPLPTLSAWPKSFSTFPEIDLEYMLQSNTRM